MISVIVPTLNEEDLLPHCLESVVNEIEELELIVVDGNSSDKTSQVARSYTDKVLTLSNADLAAQLNAGAALAKGDIILFLHADSKLTADAVSRLKTIPPGIIGGAFEMLLDNDRFSYRLLSLGGNLYCRFTGTYFGDRGIFVRSSVFKQMGGFKPLPIMTDVEFSRRLGKYGKTILLKGPIISSSRKFEREGSIHTLYLIIYALAAYRLGISLKLIKKKYYKLTG